MTTVRFLPRTIRQIEKADNWWRENRLADPKLFTQELDKAVGLITQFSNSGGAVRTPEGIVLRRALMRKTRYHVYYKYNEHKDEVMVHAVWSAVTGSGSPI